MEAASIDAAVMRVARAASREAIATGARAAVLMGSHAAGDAHGESDIDIVVIGRGPGYELARRGRFLLSTAWCSLAECRAALRSPSRAGAQVPGWRDAIILADPEGIAAGLQRRARAWRWESIDRESNDWVAGQIAGFAEEVHKLVVAIERQSMHAAAAQRSLLALHLAKILAVHHRILYGSENVLWNLVAERMGEPWATAQARALGEHDESFENTCAAALELYRLAAAAVDRTLDRRQRAVVAHACRLESL